MATRINTTIDVVLEAIAARLRSELALSEATCYWLIVDRDEQLPPPTSGATFITISPDGAEFDASLIDGGGVEQVTTTTGVSVAIHSTLQLDRGGRDKEALLNASKGILPIVLKVLKALTDHDLEVNEDGDTCLREPLRPTGYSAPQRMLDDKWTRISVYFAVSFDWDLA
jgi:hypothetical protein